ncbi:Fis family transcriptional regulator [Deltaproteobacteria bacterium Smac51]|nr:Fis family transcriptional regulator [Deltaproteobacteria bacterium Smac51]
MGKLLVIEDDFSLREMLELMLRSAGHSAVLAADGLAGLEAGLTGDFDVVISDIRMPGLTGLEVLKKLRAQNRNMPVILMSAYASPDTAVEAMREGAYDFIPKPFKPQDLLTVVDSALAHHNVEQERQALADMVITSQRFGRMVGTSPAMLHVYDLIKRAAQTSTSILITGESGTGKELVAKAVHENSQRAEREFVAINCGGIPENLVESELFGHKKGSFTGASSDKRGLVALADGGTLFLDELGELSLPMQVKLLRLIQEKTFRQVGGEREETADVRFIAATNKNLETEIMAGRFREDLYYRLNVINIHIPPLRERAADIPLLAHYFLEKYSKIQNKDVRKLSAYALDILSRYHFPGNVRELENIIERSVALEQSNIILPESLRLADFRRETPAGWPPPQETGGPAAHPAAPPPAAYPASSSTVSAPVGTFGGGYTIPAPAMPAPPPPVRETYHHLAAVLPGLPPGGIDELLSLLEGHYLYQALIMAHGARGRTATLLAISPWRLRTRLVAYELADLNYGQLTRLDTTRFHMPDLPYGLAPSFDESGLNLSDILIAVERHFIYEALEASGGNKTEAASLLGLSRRSFQHRLERTNYDSWAEAANPKGNSFS